mmetsp:Transcript_154491/g.494146  ORF Transcript_154491/g.494146 Transcript_154491/m.494146 type:complete len:289 (+) Transcript_154491:796-1662(+)
MVKTWPWVSMRSTSHFSWIILIFAPFGPMTMPILFSGTWIVALELGPVGSLAFSSAATFMAKIRSTSAATDWFGPLACPPALACAPAGAMPTTYCWLDGMALPLGPTCTSSAALCLRLSAFLESPEEVSQAGPEPSSMTKTMVSFSFSLGFSSSTSTGFATAFAFCLPCAFAFGAGAAGASGSGAGAGAALALPLALGAGAGGSGSALALAFGSALGSAFGGSAGAAFALPLALGWLCWGSGAEAALAFAFGGGGGTGVGAAGASSSCASSRTFLDARFLALLDMPSP